MAELPISPIILKWARLTAGIELADSAQKLGVSTENLQAWESGIGQPGLTILRRMVILYRRAPTVFLLSRPPEEKALPKDFRTLRGAAERLTTDVIFAIREAEENREEVKQLVEEDHSLLTIRDIGTAHLEDDPNHHAILERKRLDVSIEDQLSWSRGNSFNHWRRAVESLGILVFQRKMPVDDCLGFSLNTGGLRTIVINSGYESEEAKSFTLFHEYAHLLLHQEGICSDFAHAKGKVEPWCNRFAGALLIPGKILRRLRPQLDMTTTHTWEFDEVTKLARELKISRAALAIRLQDLGLAPRTLYEEIEARLEQEREQHKNREKREFRIPPHIKAVSAVGRATASVVLGALDKGSLDPVGASSILNLSARYFGNLKKLIGRGNERS